MELENIIKLIKTVSESSLTSFEYEEEGSRLSLQINRNVVYQDTTEGATTQVIVETKQQTDKAVDEENTSNTFICSPMVGTFYAASAEGATPYISVGDTVKKGQVIGIVEAMKLMNEIESEYDGVVEEILVNNKDMIEFGQPLVRLRPL